MRLILFYILALPVCILTVFYAIVLFVFTGKLNVENKYMPINLLLKLLPEETCTLDEAIEALKLGKTIRHKYWRKGDYATPIDKDYILFETGSQCSIEIFKKAYESKEFWKNNWEIIDLKDEYN